MRFTLRQLFAALALAALFLWSLRTCEHEYRTAEVYVLDQPVYMGQGYIIEERWSWLGVFGVARKRVYDADERFLYSAWGFAPVSISPSRY